MNLKLPVKFWIKLVFSSVAGNRWFLPLQMLLHFKGWITDHLLWCFEHSGPSNVNLTELASTRCFPRRSFGSGAAHCMFSSRWEVPRGTRCELPFWFTLPRLSVVGLLHRLSFDRDKRKTCSVRSMAVQGLISRWSCTYTKSVWRAGSHWNWKGNLCGRLMLFFFFLSVFQFIFCSSFV